MAGEKTVRPKDATGSQAAHRAVVWIVAGESSGDMYGARLAHELRHLTPTLELKGMGGEAMREAGVELLVDSTELGIVGFVEVLRHIPKFLGLFRSLVSQAVQEHPDAVVLIDYPGFNLRFARRLRAAGIRVVYYVSPQVWAWGHRRIPKIARIVDKMLVIFPFEPAVYAHTHLDVEFVGHPLVGILAEKRLQAPRQADTVLLLPGSRGNEVRRLLPVMLETARLLHAEGAGLRFVIPTPRAEIASLARGLLEAARAEGRGDMPPTEVVVGETTDWLQRAAAGIAASGTVTVEAAILGLPLVVAYRLNWLTYRLARLLVKVRFVTMVNLVCDSMVFEEFLQDEATPQNLAEALAAVLPGGARHAGVLQRADEAVSALAGQGDASRRAAKAILRCLDAWRGGGAESQTLMLSRDDAGGPD